MSKAIAYTYITVNQNKSRLTSIILGVCVFLAIIYGVNVFKTITKTVALQKLQTQTTALSGEISKLDAQYISLSRAVTSDSLASYGLTQGKVAIFISPASNAKVALSSTQ